MTSLASFMEQGRERLSEAEAKQFLRDLGIQTTRFACPERSELGSLPFPFPMTVKASSPEIVHKTELGGIFLNVHDLCELEEKYDLLASKFPAAEVLVETMEAPGPEVIIGLMDDPAFGQCIMFGMGGVQAEFYNDAAFRTVPIMRHDAKEMISETKASAFFRGFRGLRADQGAMVDLLCRISELALAHHESIAQLDLNPVILREQGYVVVDAKLKLRRDISQDRAVEGDRGREEHQGE